MSYSSAIFDEDQPLRTQSFEEAQLRKVHAILDMAKVGQDTRVLEIGTGWGTLALEAARRGATVTSVTLSKEQAALARQRVADAARQREHLVHPDNRYLANGLAGTRIEGIY